MPEPTRKRELGRGERVLPGVWRLRLPLPWPGVPHCNAWALAAGDGIVLVDTGMHEPGSFAHLERALAMVNLRIENVRLLVCTHAHSDHYGQAATIIERTGCELWMHPNHEHMTRAAQDPEPALARRLEVGAPERRAGAPLRALRGGAPGARASASPAIVEPDRAARRGRRDRDRPRHLEGRRDAGPRALARLPLPGGAPDPDLRRPPARPRLALLRLRLLARPGRASSCARSTRSRTLDMRLCLAGHGRTFTDVAGAHHGQPRARRRAPGRAACACSASSGPITAFDAVPLVHGEAITPPNANWWLSETLCYLRHLEVTGRAERVPGDEDEPERWRSRGLPSLDTIVSRLR